MSWLSTAISAVGKVIGGSGSGKPIQISTRFPSSPFNPTGWNTPTAYGTQTTDGNAALGTVPSWAILALVAVVVLILLRRG